MRKIIIFDFKRTIFDPENGSLMTDAELVLRTLKARQFDLFLVSHGTFRRSVIDDLGIKKYFKEIVISKEKSRSDFEKIIARNDADVKNSFVVGDRVRGEIFFGNLLGFQTIWLRQGLFSKELPRNSQEKPDFAISEIKKVLEIAH